ncbi:hypothetical protein PR048_024510 [Dryococelus australis]|uniref:Uncharacterized protein n=1 Tax=Dryococelus australis TaxID=614101 RepID=A0ABQ9GNT4_9NEOP|nr:hypothetical protein PR048_024510 [Dryococelus australis]
MGHALLARYGACTSGGHVVDLLTYHFLKPNSAHRPRTPSITHVSLQHGKHKSPFRCRLSDKSTVIAAALRIETIGHHWSRGSQETYEQNTTELIGRTKPSCLIEAGLCHPHEDDSQRQGGLATLLRQARLDSWKWFNSSPSSGNSLGGWRHDASATRIWRFVSILDDASYPVVAASSLSGLFVATTTFASFLAENALFRRNPFLSHCSRVPNQPIHCDKIMIFFAWAAVAERLDCSPPTKANWVQSVAWPLPDFRQVGTVPDDAAGRWVLSGISRPPPCPLPRHSDAAPYSRHSTLIGSQDLAVKSCPNLFTHSFAFNAVQIRLERHALFYVADINNSATNHIEDYSFILPLLKTVGWTGASEVKKRGSDTGDTDTPRLAPPRSYAQGRAVFPSRRCTVQIISATMESCTEFCCKFPVNKAVGSPLVNVALRMRQFRALRAEKVAYLLRRGSFPVLLPRFPAPIKAGRWQRHAVKDVWEALEGIVLVCEACKAPQDKAREGGERREKRKDVIRDVLTSERNAGYLEQRRDCEKM